MITVSSFKSSNITGEISNFADKSISHRSIILASLGVGVSKIKGLLESSDVFNTIDCFKKLGVKINKINDTYVVESLGFYSFSTENDDFYMGNSGTSCRLIAGVLAGITNKNSQITGDSSLSKRPMQRVINPLQLMGADISHNNFKLPIKISGEKLKGINYTLDVPSAQVKSSILLAGLFANEKTTVIEKEFTRDHTENMLKNLGVNIDIAYEKSQKIITIDNNQKDLPSANYIIPNDFSSASFFIALALICKDSEITIKNVNLNPLRTGFLQVVMEMGADIKILNECNLQGESVGDLLVKSSQLKGISVNPALVPTMIDEFPILSIVATFCQGKTEFKGIAELRHKESDRIQSVVSNFKKLGILFEETEDSLSIIGINKELEGGVEIESFLDHRIAMSFLILGSKCKNPLQVKGCESIKTSFPNFFELAKKVGLNLEIKNKELL
ncbi:MAG: 3-phosphoshikimate 1-carboxyvinyltransferase [Alphaproteobacteria bacterium]|jgi:3-phosphoshikimate 1-carboxyvinyltransferase|nr:3-phosphoshikimate 1-carboxyvinyltransferase [Alphaproteobacteria bacterium]